MSVIASDGNDVDVIKTTPDLVVVFHAITQSEAGYIVAKADITEASTTGSFFGLREGVEYF